MIDNEQVLICAVRYALGRRTYIVGVVARHIRCNLGGELSAECRKCIIRDISEELKSHHRAGKTLGDTFDENAWKRLLKELQEANKNE